MHIFQGLSRYTLPVVLVTLLGGHSSAKASAPLDSIRTETYKNHPVIIYKVKKKETFYSISRLYKLPASELILLNEGTKSLKIGDEIRVPMKASETSSSPASYSSVKPSVQPYKVEKGGTVYSIARKFGMSPATLIEINNLKNTALKPGQSLKIIISQHENTVNEPVPVTSRPQTDSPSKKSSPAEAPAAKILIPSTGLYVVQTGETVYSIATKYDIPVSRIQELNHLTGSGIHSGQTIKLNETAAQPVSKAAPAPIEKEEKEEPAPVRNPSGSAGGQNSGINTASLPPASKQAPSVANVKPPEIILPSPDADKNAHTGRELKEDGIGLWLNNNDLNQARSVALHRTAAVGTIIKVTNPMSKKSIFVKVVGSFPDTAENKDAVVIISKSAAELIGALDQRFRVEISYVN